MTETSFDTVNADLAAQKAMDRLKHGDFSALTREEQTLIVVWQFCAGINNGGFEGYYKSERSTYAVHAPSCFAAIGASALAGLAREANALFGPDGPPRSRNERRSVIETLPREARENFVELDRRYLACDEDPDELLEAYLNRTSAPGRSGSAS